MYRRPDYYSGRRDAFRSVYCMIRLRLDLDDAEFQKRIDGRLAFKLLNRLKIISEEGISEIKYENGRITTLIP